ncbi:MAG: hypothetical protein HY210_08095 [Candidatus Omnitrophica bacterium]|nr:hypothetical protein [Candidatus Omnitrophota bacterium]
MKYIRPIGIVLSIISFLAVAYYIKSDVPRRERADRRGYACPRGYFAGCLRERKAGMAGGPGS